MTVKELKERLSHLDGRYDDLEVCIPNNKGGMGGLSVTKVKGANRGIDWDSGKFFIWPETQMVEMSDDSYIGDKALSEEADKQAEFYAKLYPKKHKELSDDECKRLNEIAKGSYYIGYKAGYRKAKNK